MDVDVTTTGARRSMTVGVLIELLAGRDFRRQFIAGSLSWMANGLTPVALAIAFIAASGSATLFGIAMASSVTAMVLLLPVAGTWADRLHRTALMGLCDLVRALTLCYVGIRLGAGDIGVLEIIVAQAAFGAASAFYLPASTGLTVWTVPRELLQQANATQSLSRSISAVVGPAMVGVLVLSVAPGSIVVMSSLLFVFSGLTYCSMRLRATVPAAVGKTDGGLARSATIVRSSPWIWSSILCFMTTHLGVAVLMVVGPLLFTFGGYTVSAWAMLIAFMAGGNIVGDVVAFRWKPRFPLRTARVTEMLLAPLLLGVAFHWPIWLLLPLAVFAGASMTFPDSLWLTTLQSRIQPDRLSAVSAFDWLGSTVLRPVGYVLASLVATSQDLPVLLLAGSVVLVVVSRLGSLMFRDVRRFEVG
jgi:MFS family permease